MIFVFLHSRGRLTETTAPWMFSGKRLWLFYLLLPFYCWPTSGSAQTPEVTTTCGEKFPNILVLAWPKTYLRFILELGFSLAKTDREWGQDEKIRRICSSPSWAKETRNTFIIRASSKRGKMSSLLKHGTQRPINTEVAEWRPTWFPADPWQINASRTMRQARRRLPLCPCLSDNISVPPFLQG